MPMPPPRKFKRVNVEISNVCNLKCSFCPEVEKAKRIMSPAEFTRIAGQIAPLTEEVVLHLLGEPLNHPQLDSILAICTAHALPVNIVTNGILLTGPRPELLLSPIVRQVSFSLQSFEDNFKHQDPAPYLQRIKRFVERALTERPDLYVNLRFWDIDGVGTISTDRNSTDRNSTMRNALAEAFAFTWDSVHVDLRRRKSRRLRGRLYLHFDSRFEWPKLTDPVRATRGFCHGLTGHIGIHADGTVVPCCLDQSAAMPLGNVLAAPIGEILASPRAKNIRDGFAAGTLHEDLCQRCTFIARFDGRSPGKALKRDAAARSPGES